MKNGLFFFYVGGFLAGEKKWSFNIELLICETEITAYIKDSFSKFRNGMNN